MVDQELQDGQEERVCFRHVDSGRVDVVEEWVEVAEVVRLEFLEIQLGCRRDRRGELEEVERCASEMSTVGVNVRQDDQPRSSIDSLMS